MLISILPSWCWENALLGGGARKPLPFPWVCSRKNRIWIPYQTYNKIMALIFLHFMWAPIWFHVLQGKKQTNMVRIRNSGIWIPKGTHYKVDIPFSYGCSFSPGRSETSVSLPVRLHRKWQDSGRTGPPASFSATCVFIYHTPRSTRIPVYVYLCILAHTFVYLCLRTHTYCVWETPGKILSLDILRQSSFTSVSLNMWKGSAL